MRVKSVKPYKTIPTWDLEVDNFHEYLTESGLVSHNTSQILGNTESFRPKFNLFTRRVLSGDFPVLNEYLIEDLIKIGYTNEDIKNFLRNLQVSGGSVQNMDLPDDIKERYKVPWEILERDITDMSADRGRFICQSQSLNRYLQDPSYVNITSMLFHAWKKGLKTGMYYLKERQVQTVTGNIDKSYEQKTEIPIQKKKKKIVCTDEVCTMCGG